MGEWQMVPTAEAAGLLFTVGKKVEVSFERENLRDCWLPATILKNTNNNTFLVEYQQPGTGDETILDKVTVDYLHIRPSPPHLSVKNFVLLEKVDAYYDFGWWSGVVTKQLADNRYKVFFKRTKQEREFVYSRVRPHMEWKGGKWFNASQGGDMDGRTTPSLVEEQIEETTPITDKQSTIATSRMKRTRQKKIDSNDNGAPTSKKQQDEIMNDDSSKKTNCSSVGKSEGIDSEVTGMTDQAVNKSENLSTGKKAVSKLTTDSSRKRGKLTNELRSLQACDSAKGDSIKSKIEEIVEDDDISEGSIVPVVVGLQCNGMSVSQGNILQKLSIEKTRNVTESDTQHSVPLSPLIVAEKKGSEVDAASVAPKRKRGRPPKIRPLNPTTPVKVNNQNGDVVPSAPSVVEDDQKKVETHVPVKEQPGIQKAPLSKDKLPNKNTDDQLGQGTKKYTSRKGKRGKRRTISVNTESTAQDIQAALNDDQPISIWLDAKHSTVHGSGTADERLTLVARDVDSEDIPFTRTTSLWKTIESMDAFRKLPQKPHFRPLLEGVKESSREGLAIGTMVTFSTVVDKTCGLRFDEPRSTIEDCLETLVELESNGFDVKVIRDRLTRLLLIKDKQDELAERSKGVADKIEEHSVKRRRHFDEEIKAIDRQIKELEDKKKQVVLKKKKFDSEIGAMEALSEEIDEEMKGVGAEFDELAAAPL